jgi:hypothetical protein
MSLFERRSTDETDTATDHTATDHSHHAAHEQDVTDASRTVPPTIADAKPDVDEPVVATAPTTAAADADQGSWDQTNDSEPLASPTATDGFAERDAVTDAPKTNVVGDEPAFGTGRADTARTQPVSTVEPTAVQDPDYVPAPSTYGADALGAGADPADDLGAPAHADTKFGTTSDTGGLGAATTADTDDLGGATTADTDGLSAPAAAGTSTPGDDATGAGAKSTQAGAWREVLLDFVDHPRDAVEKADRLVDDALRSFTERINREHSGLRDAWKTHGEPSTEDLRAALRGYRDFFDKVLNSR